MPTNTGIDHICPGGFDRLAQRDDLFPGAALFDQINHRKTEDNHEPFAHRFANTAHNFDRKAHTVFKRPTPLIVTLVGTLADKLIDQVTF